MNKEIISLSPKIKFTANHAIASAHADLMASPQFQTAAAAALLEYQERIVGNAFSVGSVLKLQPRDMNEWSTARLQGAQEFLALLMNLGIPDPIPQRPPDPNLVPPEQFLDRPFNPPTK